MLAKQYKALLNQKSVIREISAYGTERAKEIGYENVFDFSLGNPSVPVPQIVNDTIVNLVQQGDPMLVHGYSPTMGIDSVREAIANSLNKRFDMQYTKNHIFPVSGAAAAIAHAVRAVTEPGDEVLTFAPFFAEYFQYINQSGAVLKTVPANTADFQINFDAFEEMLNPKVMAVLINTPNNPSGVVYSADTLTRLAQLLKVKEAEYGHDIYIISDEPYREIVFDGVNVPYTSQYYDNTISCYSFSKSLSMPGDRIGYIAANPACKDAELIIDMCGQISRGIGHNCPTAIMQLTIAEVLDETADLSVYETNMHILYEALTEMGYSCVKPGGTFYMFPQSLEPDAVAFCNKAKEFDLLLVPGDGFGCPGHFRIAYCVDTEKVKRSLSAFRKLAEYYQNR